MQHPGEGEFLALSVFGNTFGENQDLIYYRYQVSGIRDQGSGNIDQGTGIREQGTGNCELISEN